MVFKRTQHVGHNNVGPTCCIRLNRPLGAFTAYDYVSEGMLLSFLAGRKGKESQLVVKPHRVKCNISSFMYVYYSLFDHDGFL